jgi:hypothetical protein
MRLSYAKGPVSAGAQARTPATPLRICAVARRLTPRQTAAPQPAPQPLLAGLEKKTNQYTPGYFTRVDDAQRQWAVPTTQALRRYRCAVTHWEQLAEAPAAQQKKAHAVLTVEAIALRKALQRCAQGDYGVTPPADVAELLPAAQAVVGLRLRQLAEQGPVLPNKPVYRSFSNLLDVLATAIQNSAQQPLNPAATMWLFNMQSCVEELQAAESALEKSLASRPTASVMAAQVEAAAKVGQHLQALTEEFNKIPDSLNGERRGWRANFERVTAYAQVRRLELSLSGVPEA